MLRGALAGDVDLSGQLWMEPPGAMHYKMVDPEQGWSKADILANNKVKFELFERFGVLPGSSDTHVVEFFPGFVTAASDYGRDWAVHHYGMHGHQSDKADDDAEMADLLAAESIPEVALGRVRGSPPRRPRDGRGEGDPRQHPQHRSGREPRRTTSSWSAWSRPVPTGSGPGTGPRCPRSWASTSDGW